jgi:hypothetical protein
VTDLRDMSPRCVFCGEPAPHSAYQVCSDHHDLIELDPGAPSALEETRAAHCPSAEPAAGLASSRALVSSSADSPDGTIGDGLSGAAALDSLEKT